jgi:APA family basic amino acid/polyamine antiporter
VPEKTANPGRLLQVLGAGFGLAVIIGNTIGAGILRAPGQIAALLPSPWLFLGAWVLGGCYALLGAISIAELATAIPVSGGQYVFARRALGPYAGFVVGWTDWLATCGTAAAVSILIGEYSGALFELLRGKTTSSAAFIVILFAVLQWRGIRWGSSIQNVTSSLKALGFLGLVIACFTLSDRAPSANFPQLLPGGASLLVAFILALQAVIFTYDGWTGVIYFSEEVRHPGREIPRALFGGVLSIIVIYLLVNLALLYVIPIGQLAGKTLAIGAAADVVFGRYGDTVVRSLTIISMLSGINAYHLMASRVLFSMSRDGLFSRAAVKVNAGGTPTISLACGTAVALFFVLSGTFEKIIAVLAFFFVAAYTLSFLSLFILRRREPLLNRPYRAWGYPWTTGIAFAGSVFFLLGAVAGDTRNSINALMLLAASYPAYVLMKRLKA